MSAHTLLATVATENIYLIVALVVGALAIVSALGRAIMHLGRLSVLIVSQIEATKTNTAAIGRLSERLDALEDRVPHGERW